MSPSEAVSGGVNHQEVRGNWTPFDSAATTDSKENVRKMKRREVKMGTDICVMPVSLNEQWHKDRCCCQLIFYFGSALDPAVT